VLLTNGRIYTMDAAGSVVDGLVVRDGRIVFAGRRDELSLPAGEPVVDLGGRAVLPGLVDGHGHLIHQARLRLSVDVAGFPSETATAGRIGAAAAVAPAGEWITGRGWDQDRWAEPRFPTRASLDGAAPRHPVALIRVDDHATCVN